MHKTRFGYFDDVDQEKPAFDPGLNIGCPVCGHQLDKPVVTTSLMLPQDGRSYFYRMHKQCWESMTEEERTLFDSDLIDALASAGNAN